MGEWQETKFSEFCTITRGGSPRPIQNYISEIGTPWVKIADATSSNNRYIATTKENIKKEGEDKSRVVYPGDLIVSNSATPGLPRFMKIRACIHDGWLLLRDIKGLDEVFLYYLILAEREAILIQGNGSIFTNLKTDILKNHKVKLPPQPEQKAIASVLSSLDDKIDLLHRQNKTLEAMAETLFRQWFVEEAQGEWEDVKIKEFDAIVTDYVANGSFASLSENVKYKSEPDFAILVRLTDYNNGFSGDFVYIDKHAYNFLEKSKLFGGEIIISNVGAYSGTVFRCPKLKMPMTLGPNSIVIKSEYNGFFYSFFRSSYGQYLLDGIISGSAQPKFNKTAFRNISLNFPSIQYIIDFEILVKPYFDKIDFNYSQINTLEKLRDTLLPKLMSGEIRVKI